jgi:hypothetical protein
MYGNGKHKSRNKQIQPTLSPTFLRGLEDWSKFRPLAQCSSPLDKYQEIEALHISSIELKVRHTKMGVQFH